VHFLDGVDLEAAFLEALGDAVRGSLLHGAVHGHPLVIHRAIPEHCHWEALDSSMLCG